MARVVDLRDEMPRHPHGRRWRTRDRATRIVVHTTASNNQDPRKTARYHVTPGPGNHLSKKGAPGLAYHDFITKDGTVYHCNDYTDITWHCRLWNRSSVGVTMAFKGQDGGPPEPAQDRALREHLVVLCLYMGILPKNIRGHREAPGMSQILGNGVVKYRKVCPGMGVDLDELRDDVTRRLQRRLSAEGLYSGGIDSLFGTKSRRALTRFRELKDQERRISWRS